MDVKYAQFTSIPEPEILNGILRLHKRVFGHSNHLIERMESKPGLLIIVAMHGEKVIGFKIGYKLDDEKFYSWLGGVDEKYRGNGIAAKLMELQHHNLRENGFSIVQTKTKNKWRNMLILNIKSGFDVIGTYTDERGEPKIILQKKLSDLTGKISKL
ncbi:GNAT family N-acetyltransferase [Siminovitchia fortis]|uniref:N-acetyltransferase n=1 Tax=Siminovitchia fortis TaxID=254758 RepID=A0A443IK58_9BACI|nr:GNAT family N-acetyltransferase [Siminovitchia fortis]RWR05283.1 N-acetyltransferase [Siminovitchia fortis]WHY82429.1 GNAT family N-acetyltransferase [Siminovitchia fortis]